jgi:hypothetical protein
VTSDQPSAFPNGYQRIAVDFRMWGERRICGFKPCANCAP